MKKRSKYRAVRTNGFDSKLEAKRAGQLAMREKCGLISNLELQPKVYLTDAKILYKPDFKYAEAGGREVWEDVKGYRTPVFNLKARLWKHYGPGPLLLTNAKGVFETIEIEIK